MPISMPESGQNHHPESAKERQSVPPLVEGVDAALIHVALKGVAYARRDVVDAIRDQTLLSPDTLDALVSAEITAERSKRLLMGLHACGLASLSDVEQFFADGELKGL